MPSRRGGFTLLEMMFVLALTGVVMALAFEAIRRAGDSTNHSLSTARAETDASDLAERIADEIRQSGPSAPTWSLDPSGHALTYNLCTGFSMGARTWGASRILTTVPLESGAGAADGLDNNHNGLVDEMSVVLKDAASGTILETWNTRLVRDGMTLAVSGSKVSIAVSLQAPGANPGDPPGTSPASTLVAPRN